MSSLLKQIRIGLAYVTFRYFYLHTFHAFQYYSKKIHRKKRLDKKTEKIVITLSTIPSRMNKIYRTLASLLDQTLLPDEIIIAIPRYSIRENKKYIIPSYLLDHPRITILQCDTDYGPATKFIPTYFYKKNELNIKIIIVDDDNIYPKNLCETLVELSEKFPSDAICLRGNLLNHQKSCVTETTTGLDVKTCQTVDVMQGSGGFLIKPRFLDSAIADYQTAPKAAFFVDDVWVSGHLSRNNITKRLVPTASPYIYLTPLHAFTGLRLSKKENLTLNNLKETVLFFKDYWAKAV